MMPWNSFLPIRNIQSWRWPEGLWRFQIDRLILFLIRITTTTTTIIITTLIRTHNLKRRRLRRRGI